MRQVFMSSTETETPADLRHGEVVEVVRLGGPRDGDTMGYFKVKLDGDGLDLEPVRDVWAPSGHSTEGADG